MPSPGTLPTVRLAPTAPCPIVCRQARPDGGGDAFCCVTKKVVRSILWHHGRGWRSCWTRAEPPVLDWRIPGFGDPPRRGPHGPRPAPARSRVLRHVKQRDHATPVFGTVEAAAPVIAQRWRHVLDGRTEATAASTPPASCCTFTRNRSGGEPSSIEFLRTPPELTSCTTDQAPDGRCRSSAPAMAALTSAANPAKPASSRRPVRSSMKTFFSSIEGHRTASGCRACRRPWT